MKAIVHLLQPAFTSHGSLLGLLEEFRKAAGHTTLVHFGTDAAGGVSQSAFRHQGMNPWGNCLLHQSFWQWKQSCMIQNSSINGSKYSLFQDANNILFRPLNQLTDLQNFYIKLYSIDMCILRKAPNHTHSTNRPKQNLHSQWCRWFVATSRPDIIIDAS